MKTLTSVRGFALATAIAVLAGAAPSQAAFHLARIDEVLTSYGGDNTAQFVEIRMLGGGQNFTNGTRLSTFDASGTFKATNILAKHDERYMPREMEGIKYDPKTHKVEEAPKP